MPTDIEYVVAAPAFSAGISGGNTAGNTGITGTRVVFAGGTNITLSGATDASGETISINAFPALSYFEPAKWVATSALALGGSRAMFMQLQLQAPLSANTVFFWASVSLSTSSNSSAGGTIGLCVGIYSKTGSSLSLMVSGTTDYSWSNTSNNQAASLTDMRRFDVSLSHTSVIPPGNYWLAVVTDITFTNANWLSASLVGSSVGAGNPRGPFFAASNNTYHRILGEGSYSVADDSLRNSYGFSEITQQASAQRSIPWFALAGMTA